MKTKQNSTQPIFQTIFGDQWEELPAVLKRHYANRAYCSDEVVVEGMLDVYCKSVMKLLGPLFRLLGLVPMKSQSCVPVTVTFNSDPETSAFHFNREFQFSDGKPFKFCSRMVQERNSDVVEIMNLGICWRNQFQYQDGKVIMSHRGYALKLGSLFIPLPVTFLIGRGDAEEVAIDDNHFDMKMQITHAIFGVIYSYSGRFKVIKEAS